jgi:hypothetical protein
MKDNARLIIPVWGEQYVGRVLSVTLPAVLAPGNLPALCDMFKVELVIVTEARLFDFIRSSQSFQSAARLCAVRFAPLDDLITDVHGDYGMVLTYALFRGFTDLGARMTDTYLLFLNADFVISDGSLRYLGKLMCQGRRLIQAPSFRVVLEDIWPYLQARVDAKSSALSLASRELAKLALAYKHPSVKARTVNQRLRHLSWMDQYYWYVDEDTMIGYQSPMALVSIRPERVVTKPCTFWDYGFIPEAAPSAEPTFVSDSDDFFMIEPQSRETGSEMMKIGWVSIDELARTESMRATKEHRESGKQLMKIHAGDLPDDLQDFIEESRAYMAGIYSRLSASPAPSVGHPLLGQWFEEAKQRQRGASGQGDRQDLSSLAASAQRGAGVGSLARTLLRPLEAIYRNTFGSPPNVGNFHPLWIDAWPVYRKIVAWRNEGKQNFLWISSVDSMFNPLFDYRVDLATLLVSDVRGAFLEKAPYDACVCQLTLTELSHLDRLYSKIRPLIKDNGQIIVDVVKSKDLFDGAEFILEHTNYPDLDVSEIHFYGTTTTTVLRALYRWAGHSFLNRPVMRVLTVGTSLLLLAPIVWLANTRAARRDTTIFSGVWTSSVIEFTVKRGRPGRPERKSDQERLVTFSEP